MRRYALTSALIALALVATLAWLTLAPPSRHYDAEAGVMCYATPAAISCVRVAP